MKARDRLHRAYPALRRAEKAIRTAAPGRKLEMRKAKVRVMAGILREELRHERV